MKSRLKIKKDIILNFQLLKQPKILGSSKSKITKNENGENVPSLEITEVVLVHCNIVTNNYQQNSTVLNTFVPNKSFVQLLYISPNKTFRLRILIYCSMFC